MKTFSLILITILLMTSALSAGEGSLGDKKKTDKFTGEYSTKDKKVTGSIERFLTKDGDLISPPEYTYFLTLDGEEEYFSNVYEVELTLESNELVSNLYLECDDPGCYFVEGEVVVKKSGRKMIIQYDYEWFFISDGDQEDSEGSGSIKLIKD